MVKYLITTDHFDYKNNMEILNLIISNRKKDWDWLSKYVDQERYIDIVLNTWLYYACKGGHLDIVKLMNKNGVENFNDGLNGACKGGHIKIVKLIIEQGENDFDWIWFWSIGVACKRGHIDIVKLLIEKCYGLELVAGLLNACKGGHLDIVKLMIEKEVMILIMLNGMKD